MESKVGKAIRPDGDIGGDVLRDRSAFVTAKTESDKIVKLKEGERTAAQQPASSRVAL
jgi:hypothetical protein